MFLNGTAMSGGADHHAMDGATFLGPAATADRYRFLAVGKRFPGLLPVEIDGGSISGELYEVTEAILFGSLLPTEPPELEVGTIELDDGQIVSSMQLQVERLDPADEVIDITDLGGWRAYQQHLKANAGIRRLLGTNGR